MTIEVWVLIDADGNSWVSNDPDTLDEDHEACNPTRVLKVTLDVPTPEHIELSAIVPAEAIPAEPVTMTVK